MTRYHVAPDADGTPVLWGELGGPDPQMIAYRDGHRIHVIDTHADQIWGLLTAVLAPTDEQVEQLANVAHRHDRTRYQSCGECGRIFVHGTAYEHAVHQTREILAALTDTGGAS